jgi:hypothetical protein
LPLLLIIAELYRERAYVPAVLLELPSLVIQSLVDEEAYPCDSQPSACATSYFRAMRGRHSAKFITIQFSFAI